jgi:hypothetical protein
MKLVADSGLWSTGPAEQLSPLVAVLEVSGAVLSWTVDDPAGADATRITFTDPARADWLWRVVGETGHVRVVAAAVDGSGDLSGVDVAPGSLASARRLAVGHWLRRWWPASQRDGIVALDRALLDVEVALLTAGAQGFFTDDTLDSDVTELLAPHATALITRLRSGDPRVGDLVRGGVGLADEVGIDGVGWPELSAALEDSSTVLATPSGSQDDYALAAGSDTGPRAGAISRGIASVNWSAVPSAIFDAGEDTVEWSIQQTGTEAVVRAALIGPDPATGIPVQLRSGAVSGNGTLDAGGDATLPLLDAQQQPMTESAAWNHDWTATSIHVGAPATESRKTRERVRRWARGRLEQPPQDAFLAEILAAESAY